MSKLDDLLGGDESDGLRKPEGMEWYAAVHCQMCGMAVMEQTLYPAEQLLVWTCSSGHRSFIEGYTAF